MNYNFAFIVHDFFVQDTTGSSVTKFDARLKELREAFGNNVALNMQNLMDSHDATRIGSAVANPDGVKFGDWGKYFNWSQKSNNKNYNARKPTAEQLQKQKLIAAFQILYLGSPMIYYGDEAGMWGSNDPDCRKPMVWADKNYDPEVYNPDQSTHAPDEVKFNSDLFNWYQKFIGLRNKYAAIRLGDYTTLVTDDANKLYAFSRKYGEEEVMVVVNRGSKPVVFSNAVLKKGAYKDVFTIKRVKEARVNAMDVVVLTNKLR
jgi:glycosidase